MSEVFLIIGGCAKDEHFVSTVTCLDPLRRSRLDVARLPITEMEDQSQNRKWVEFACVTFCNEVYISGKRNGLSFIFYILVLTLTRHGHGPSQRKEANVHGITTYLDIGEAIMAFFFSFHANFHREPFLFTPFLCLMVKAETFSLLFLLFQEVKTHSTKSGSITVPWINGSRLRL